MFDRGHALAAFKVTNICVVSVYNFGKPALKFAHKGSEFYWKAVMFRCKYDFADQSFDQSFER